MAHSDEEVGIVTAFTPAVQPPMPGEKCQTCQERHVSATRFRVRAFLALLSVFVLGQAAELAIILSASGNWGAVVWPW